jgi:broad specificity phosphatase PhoE
MYPDFRRLTAQTSFYFVRHGESQGNSAGIVQGTAEYPLSETGRAHAEQAATWLAESGISLCLSSPLARAMDTARAIAGRLEIAEPTPEENLLEIDTGIFTGLTFPEIIEQYPDHYSRFLVESWECVPDAERTDSLYQRSVALWTQLIDWAEAGHRSIACVTHNGTLQWILKASFGVPEQPWMPIFKMANCGISLFQARPAYYDEERSSDAPADGYFGQWELINRVPYDE